MPYPYDQIFAGDPSAPERVAVNGVVTIFEPGDASMTPLAITTLDGMPLANPLQVNEAGFGPAFQHATLDQVAWSGGGFSGLLVSYPGMKKEAVAARQAAQEAAAAAQAPTKESIDQGIARADIPKTVATAIAATPAVTEAAAAAVDANPKIAQLEAADWLKDVVVTAGGDLDAFAGVTSGRQVKAKIPNATVAATVAGWPAELTPQGAVVVSHGVTGSASLQQLQTHSNTDPRLYIRTVGQAWREITRQYRRYPARAVALSAGSMYLQRSGYNITVTLNAAKAPVGSNLIGTLPAGYRNEIRNAFGFSGRTGTGLPASFEITEYGEVRQYTTHDSALYGVLTFQTNEEYPA